MLYGLWIDISTRKDGVLLWRVGMGDFQYIFFKAWVFLLGSVVNYGVLVCKFGYGVYNNFLQYNFSNSLLKEMAIFLNNQFPLNLSQVDDSCLYKEILDSFLKNNVPIILHVITQCIGICLTVYDRTLLYVKTNLIIYTSYLSVFSQDLELMS